MAEPVEVDLAGWLLQWHEGERFATITSPAGVAERVRAVVYARDDDRQAMGPDRDDLTRLLVEYVAGVLGERLDD